ncbi:type II toxin-antitoxin system RelE/ParE family toxin [Erwinia sp. SLM-02]|uniref:type II toxin-antitoxin system RelE/ParE family toxin n=1 Tax=Erwinia sp. SLM-02 TaxID=3020057 RepID=UPI00307FF651
MVLLWTQPAIDDLERIYRFLVSVNPLAAAGAVQSLVAAAKNLTVHPRSGTALGAYHPRDVRRLILGHYEMRYEFQEETVSILRIWHTREHRLINRTEPDKR